MNRKYDAIIIGAGIIGNSISYEMSKKGYRCDGNDHDKKPFQYQMKYLKRAFNIGFFSRNRKINKESSFSVIG